MPTRPDQEPGFWYFFDPTLSGPSNPDKLPSPNQESAVINELEYVKCWLSIGPVPWYPYILLITKVPFLVKVSKLKPTYSHFLSVSGIELADSYVAQLPA